MIEGIKFVEFRANDGGNIHSAVYCIDGRKISRILPSNDSRFNVLMKGLAGIYHVEELGDRIEKVHGRRWGWSDLDKEVSEFYSEYLKKKKDEELNRAGDPSQQDDEPTWADVVKGIEDKLYKLCVEKKVVFKSKFYCDSLSYQFNEPTSITCLRIVSPHGKIFFSARERSPEEFKDKLQDIINQIKNYKSPAERLKSIAENLEW